MKQRPSGVSATKGLWCAGLVLTTILVGCTLGRDGDLGVQEQIETIEAGAKAHKTPEAEAAVIGGDFVGMSQKALRDCAGAPDEQFGADPSIGLEQWVYQLEPPRRATVDSYCKATFSLKNGQVANAVFTRRDGTRVKDLSKCSELIDACR